MAGYLGAIPVPQATQHRESFTATSGQTTFNTAGYTVGFLDVYLNGSHLSPADFTATNGSDVVLAVGASTGDVCDIISYTAFEVNSQTFTGTTTLTGDLALGDNDKAIFGAGSDLQIYHDGSNSYIDEQGTGNLNVRGTNLVLGNASGSNSYLAANDGGGVYLYHAGQNKLETTSTGIDVTGGVSIDDDNNLSFGDGTAYIQGSGANDRLKFITNNSEAMRIDSSGHLLINNTAYSANGTLVVQQTADSKGVAIIDSGAANTFFLENDGTINKIRNNSTVPIAFETNSAERMRIDSSGNLLVGTTNATIVGNGGIGLKSDGRIDASTSGGSTMLLERRTNDGDIAAFYKDGTAVGSIGVSGGTVVYAGNTHGIMLNGSTIAPSNNSGTRVDNTMNIGSSSFRYDDIFATNGTIQTSDRNEKQDIAALTSAEMLVGKRISALFKTFRWKDKVAEKGDNARTHTGIIAQDVQSAFTAEGLDAGDYSLFISTTWWEHDVDVPAVEAVAEVTEDVVIAAVQEQLDEEGNVLVEAQEERTEQRLITEAVEAKDAYTRTDMYDTEDEAPEGATSKTRMGIRYPELLSFLAAYNEQRFASIETRLTALEG